MDRGAGIKDSQDTTTSSTSLPVDLIVLFMEPICNTSVSRKCVREEGYLICVEKDQRLE